MKFEEAIKMVGKQYIQEEIKCREENDITIKLPIRFKIRMWWMFKKEKFKSYYLQFFMDHCNMQWSIQTVDKVPVFAGTFTMSTVFLV